MNHIPEQNISKKFVFHITRTIKEEYSVEAMDEQEAARIVAHRGDPFSITVIKETIRKIPNQQKQQTP